MKMTYNPYLKNDKIKKYYLSIALFKGYIPFNRSIISMGYIYLSPSPYHLLSILFTFSVFYNSLFLFSCFYESTVCSSN